MNGSAGGSKNCREQYGAWGALRYGRSFVIMSGYFCWSSAENMWKHGRSGEHMGREMFRETGCILRELSGVLKREEHGRDGELMGRKKFRETGSIMRDLYDVFKREERMKVSGIEKRIAMER